MTGFFSNEIENSIEFDWFLANGRWSNERLVGRERDRERSRLVRPAGLEELYYFFSLNFSAAAGPRRRSLLTGSRINRPSIHWSRMPEVLFHSSQSKEGGVQLASSIGCPGPAVVGPQENQRPESQVMVLPVLHRVRMSWTAVANTVLFFLVSLPIA